MSDSVLRNPFVFGGALILSGVVGAGAFALIQNYLPIASQGKTEQIVRNYILENPEIIPEAIDRLRAAETAKAAEAQKDATKALPEMRAAVEKAYPGAVAGNPNGDVTVVAFMDYACGYCRASVPIIEELIAKDPNVRIVYREYPVLGQASVVAARWALAAADQGKYLPFHNAVYAEGPPSEESIRASAQKAGLDLAKAAAAADSKAVIDEVQNNHAMGQKLVIDGTPSWIIGGQVLRGAFDVSSLAAAVAAARATK